MDMTLKQLFDCAMGRNIPAEFANENVDYEAALRDEVNKLMGNYYDRKRNAAQVYEILAENAEIVLPNRVEEILGGFCDVQQYGNKDRLVFKTKEGHTRGKQFVTRCAEAGVYETFRLDKTYVELVPHAFGGAGIIDFERYLDGDEDIMDIYDIILEGMVDRIFEEVQGCLINSWDDTGRPSANKVAVSAFDAAKMASLIQTVSAYGKPVIYCGPQFAITMSNSITVGTTTRILERDVEEYREYGYIGKFAGAPVIVLPNSFKDEYNTKLSINPRYAYVIPTSKEKIVKVALVGPTIIDEFKNADRSIEIQGYKKVAVGIVTRPNYWGIYYNSGIAAGGWDNPTRS